MSRIAQGSAPSAPLEADVWEMLDWRDGLLIFHATPLARVVAEVESQFGVPFVIRDSSIAQRSVTAWFEDEAFEEVVSAICQVVGASCVMGDTVEVRP
jgi:ferric-dicitrate binding protein FerR (iron transport regulator)